VINFYTFILTGIPNFMEKWTIQSDFKYREVIWLLSRVSLDQFCLTTYRHSNHYKKTDGIIKNISLFSFVLRYTPFNQESVIAINNTITLWFLMWHQGNRGTDCTFEINIEVRWASQRDAKSSGEAGSVYEY
jgi:hypothetical protein